MIRSKGIFDNSILVFVVLKMGQMPCLLKTRSSL